MKSIINITIFLLAQKKKRNIFQFMKAWNISGPDQHMAWEPHWSHQWSQVDQSPHWTHARRVEWPSMRKDDYMVYNLYTILYTIINQAGENSSICSANIYNSCQPGSVTQCDSVCTGQCKGFLRPMHVRIHFILYHAIAPNLTKRTPPSIFLSQSQ